MAYRNVTIINGRKVELKELEDKDRERLVAELCRRMAGKLGYTEVKTAN